MNKGLSKEEIMSLISEYRSEIRKNLARNEDFIERIEKWQHILENGYESNPQEDVETFEEEPRQRKKEERPRKPYPLSKWDEIILEIVRENGKPTLSKDIYEKTFAKVKEEGLALEDDEKTKAKINQCLVKLSGRRNDLLKIRYGGKGLAYCLPDWTKNNH